MNQDASSAGGSVRSVRGRSGAGRSPTGGVTRPVVWSGSRSDDEVMPGPLPATGGIDAEGRSGVDEGRVAGRPVATPQGGVAGRRHGGSVGVGEPPFSVPVGMPGMSPPTAWKPLAGVTGSSDVVRVGPNVPNGGTTGRSVGRSDRSTGDGKPPDGGPAGRPGIGMPPDGGPVVRPGIGNGPVVGPWGRASGGGGGPTSTSSAEPQPRRLRRQEPDGGPVSTSPCLRREAAEEGRAAGPVGPDGGLLPGDVAGRLRRGFGRGLVPALRLLGTSPGPPPSPQRTHATQRSHGIDPGKVGPHGASRVEP